MEYTFKKLSTHEVVDVYNYIDSYMTDKPNSKIYVGCDSQNKNRNTEFAIVIVFHNKNRGGHVLYTNIICPLIKDRFYRLFSEACYALEIANNIRDNTGRTVDYVDLDLNPDPNYNSNAVLNQASGMIISSGFDVRCKPDAMSASYAADRLCKK